MLNRTTVDGGCSKAQRPRPTLAQLGQENAIARLGCRNVWIGLVRLDPSFYPNCKVVAVGPRGTFPELGYIVLFLFYTS